MKLLSKLSLARGASLLQVSTIGLFNVYEVAQMSAQGLPGKTIGLLLAIENGLLLVSGALWGWVADRYGCYRQLVMGSALVLAFTLFWLSSAESVFNFTVYAVLRGVSMTAMMTVMPALAMANLKELGPGKSYSKYRVFGSIGFMIGTAILPIFFDSITSILRAASLILPFSLIFIMGLENPELEEKSVELSKKSKVLPAVVWWYLAANFIVSFTEPGNLGFLNDYVIGLGGSPKLIGWYSGMTGFIALISLPLMGKWVDARGVKWVIVFGFLSQVLRPLSISLIPDPNWLWASHVFHFFGWAGREVGSIVFMTMLLGERRRAVAVSLVVTIRTAGVMVGSYFMGTWADAVGYQLMFQRVFFVACLSLPLLYIALRKSDARD
ncbi:MFS transporter [Puniceicoccaceae bacterium K14]|nr:MFS transporter [Puniceicoccaceae bacterium K14]